MSRTSETKIRPLARSAFKERNWEVLFVSLVFLLALLATVAMILVSILDPKNSDNQFRILPAASLMIMVELWVIFSLPFYGKLSFWGAIIFLATYLFFAVPFVFLQLLPGMVGIGAGLFILVTAICGLLLFRQRDYFLRPSVYPSKKTSTNFENKTE